MTTITADKLYPRFNAGTPNNRQLKSQPTNKMSDQNKTQEAGQLGSLSVTPGSAKWTHDRYGPGSSLTLIPGIELYVTKSRTRGEGYLWRALGRVTKPKFEHAEQAQEAAINYARKALTAALAALPNQPC